MNGRGFIVDKFDSLLETSQLLRIISRTGGLTATPNKPHFRVSALMLFRLTCHFKGVTLSVAMYIKVSVCS